MSLEDDLMRRFGSERMDGMLQRLGLKEGEAIIHPWINKALEKAQQKVEAYNFEIRKQLLKFDDVMNDQRKVVYEQRRELMEAEDVADTVRDMRHQVHRGPGRQAHPGEGLSPSSGTSSSCTARRMRASISTCRWPTGPRRRGSPSEEIRERLLKASDELMAAKVGRSTASR